MIEFPVVSEPVRIFLMLALTIIPLIVFGMAMRFAARYEERKNQEFRARLEHVWETEILPELDRLDRIYRQLG